MSLAQKIIARASGRESVNVGDIVTCHVDLAMIHDSGGPRRVEPILQHLQAPLFDKSKVVLVSDHYVPGDEPESKHILDLTRRWAVEREVTFYDGEGICHVVVPERGHLGPGMLVTGGDSHSPTGGAFGAYMFGIGSTEMAGVLATGEIWLQVPKTILLNWQGHLGAKVVAKDMMLAMCAKLGMDGGQYQAIEYTGDTIAALCMQERMTLCNMAAELGAQAGLIAPDAITIDALKQAGYASPSWHKDVPANQNDYDSQDAEPITKRWPATTATDADQIHYFDASTLAPQVAAPHSPANATSVHEQVGQTIDVAYIGACTGAKYVDLAMAASVLRGKKVASGTQLIVAPASNKDKQRAEADGTMQVLSDAGARFLVSACGICAGYGTERLGAGVRCISTTARNFKGRMGEASSAVWLASPYTVAATAIAGKITDPREMQ